MLRLSMTYPPLLSSAHIRETNASLVPGSIAVKVVIPGVIAAGAAIKVVATDAVTSAAQTVIGLSDAVVSTVDASGRIASEVQSTLRIIPENAALAARLSSIVLSVVPDPTPEGRGYALYRAGTAGKTITYAGTKIPLVFIHGLQVGKQVLSQFDSWYPDNAGEMWTPLLSRIRDDAILSAVFEPWIFRYPTYLPMTNSAAMLGTMISQRFNAKPVVVIAHSMGGMVGGVHLLNAGTASSVARMITLGTPFLGSPLAQSQGLFTGTCVALSSNSFYLGVAAGWTEAKLWPWIAGWSQGFQDLAPSSAVVGQFNNRLSEIASRVFAIGGTSSLGSGTSTEQGLLRLSSCVLDLNGRTPNDGIVPLTSSIPPALTNQATTPSSHLSIYSDPTAVNQIAASLNDWVSRTPASLSFSVQPPARTSVGAALPTIRVVISSLAGGVVGTATTAVALTLSPNTTGARLIGVSTKSAVNGVASFDGLSIDAVGTYSLVAAAGGLPNAGSSAVTVDPPAVAAKLAFVAPPSPSTTGSVLVPSVQVAIQSATGATVAGATNTITIAMLPSPGALGGTIARQAVNGVATFDNLSVSTAGSYTLTAASSGIAGATSPMFTVTSGTGNSGLGIGFGDEQFATIPAGSFRMGSANGDYDEQPIHTVTLSAFRMQKTEVTQAQWRSVMGNGIFAADTCDGNCPADGRSFDAVVQFIARLNQLNPGKTFRLPTEAEWEYAARAGTTGDFGGTGNIDQMGWYNLNAGLLIHGVAQKRPNDWGLYDMHGNLAEWVQDFHGIYPSNAVVNPTGPTSGFFRILRGGWFFSDAGDVRSARRQPSPPSSGPFSNGFRLVISSGSSAALGVGFGDEQFSSLAGGTFQMGSADWPAIHAVTLSAFRIQRTEVTQGQWRAVMGNSPSSFTACGNTCPVEQVSGTNVQQFFNRLNQQDPGKGYRLPTEAEWEYAARAGTTGDLYNNLDDVEPLGWIQSNSERRTHAAAQKLPNGWGLFDMYGNVSEWVSDEWEPRYQASSQTNPTGPESGTLFRVTRGGSWRLNYASSAFRDFASLVFGDSEIGFRLVRNP
ncbi:SUMF1/EgtB/PvdO family nonheme iron enzyme [Gemmatimonas sp.]|uniref:SUMF1/EgtB/PvdO family nonheme iron enzyme n=1 Tax=Gemmatimonas sp. TaxID=1962908 RepID=UPI00286E1DAB|nr:SUMF1/EgtB/PvdO family nonheme iron enzyme [Gemmatimonas sp.]